MLSVTEEPTSDIQALKEEVTALRLHLNSSLDIICSTNIEGKFVYVSAAAKEVWGYEPEEMIGKKFIDFIVAEDYPKTVTITESIISGVDITSFENRYLKKDGSVVPLFWSARWCADRQIMYYVAKDATQIKKAEQQTRLLDERLSRAYKLAKIAWWEYDIATQTYTCSNEIFTMYGLSMPKHNQITLEDFLSLVYPEDRPRLQQDLSSICEDTYVDYEHRIVKPTGEVIYVIHYSKVIRDEKGSKVAVHGTTKDITLRKLQQLHLEDSKRQLQQYSHRLSETLESIGDGFFTLDKDWTVTYWNRKAEDLLGKKREEILGQSLWQHFKEAVSLKFYSEYHRAISEGVAVQFEEYFPPLKMWMEVAAYPSNEGLAVYFKDINKRKWQEEALQLANERYEIASTATSDAIYDWNLLTNEIYFSIMFKTLFGHENKSDSIYKTWAQNTYKEDVERVLASLQTAFNDPSIQLWEGQYRFHRKDGRIAYVLDRGNIIRGEDGKALRMVGSMQDITKLKEVECAMAKSEKRFKAMVQSGNDLIMLLNASFECIYTSPNYAAVVGYSAEEMSGFLPHDKVHPDDYQPLLQAAQNIFTTSPVQLPLFRFQTKEGNYRWYEATLSNHLNNPDIEAIVSNIRDVTEKVAADEEMQRLSLVAKETVNAVVITDAEDKISWVNKAFTDITEYNFKEVIGRKPDELLQGPNTSKRTKHYLAKCVEKRQPFNCEILNYTKSGREYWMDIKGQPMFDEKGELKHFFAIQTDITTRKEAEALIQTSEEKYKLLFYNSPIPKWIFHAETFRIVDVNIAALALYGYSKGEFLHLKVQDLKLPEDERELVTAVAALKKNKNGHFQRIVRLKKKNGETFYMDITGFPIELGTGLHLMITGTDMTEKLRLQQQVIAEKVLAQKQIARAIIHAQETERSEIGKELHDNVCQLLTTSKLYIENIKHMPEQQEEFTKKGIDLLLQSINEIRYLSRQLVSPIDNGNSFEASVQELISHYRSMNLFEVCFNYEATIELVDKDLKTSIIRILQEQFNNTVKYAKASSVKVCIGNTEDLLILHYQDNGVGFDPAESKKGIGLSNIENRASSYRGKVKLQTAIGKGCTMKITFPLTEQTEAT